jgi:hypothetical protein
VIVAYKNGLPLARDPANRPDIAARHGDGVGDGSPGHDDLTLAEALGYRLLLAWCWQTPGT